jgi:hypothetical protein
MPAWLTGLVAIIQSVPSFIALIEQVIAAVSGHPAGAAAGVAHVQLHMDKYEKPTA